MIESPKRDLMGMFGALIATTDSVMNKRRTELTFHRYGDKYFLAKIFVNHIEYQTNPSADENQLQRSGAAMAEIKLKVKM